MRIQNQRVAATLGAALALSIPAATAATTSAMASESPQSELSRVREATAKYQDVTVAEADGYVGEGHECVPAMGIHYINFAQMGKMDPLQPDALLYEPSGQGPRLVAVEWIAIDDDQDLTTDNQPVPSLFGHRFDGPMPGHGPGMPVHYDLHAYVWQANPAGVLATWNENVHC